MLKAIEVQAAATELRRGFVAAALPAEQEVAKYGKVYSLDEMNRYLKAKVAGANSKPPRARKASGALFRLMAIESSKINDNCAVACTPDPLASRSRCPSPTSGTRAHISPGARRDLDRHSNFLIASDATRAAQTTDVIISSFMTLREHPAIGRTVELGLREPVISRGRSGYLALYRFDLSRSLVRILAVRHQREAAAS